MNLDRLKPLVNTPHEWELFKEYVEDLIEVASKNLATQTDLHLIYRLQGELKVLRQFLNLRDNVNGVR